MDSNLAVSLVNKGVLKTGTEIEARYLAAGLGGVGTVYVVGEFTIERTGNSQDGKLVFVVNSTRDGKQRNLLAESIMTIDGMEPARFAAVYNIKADGTGAKTGKRRGRKPKDRSGTNGGDNQPQ